MRFLERFDIGSREELTRFFYIMDQPGDPSFMKYARLILDAVPQPRDDAAFWATWIQLYMDLEPLLAIEPNKYLVTVLQRSLANTSIGAAYWLHLGAPIFTLTHDFTAAIAVTDFGDACDDQLELPFPSFVLRANFAEATGLFVRRIFRAEAGRAFFCGGSLSVLRADASDNRRGHLEWGRLPTTTEFLTARPQPQSKADPLIRAAMEQEESLGKPMPVGKPVHPAQALARRVLVNTCLYINSNGGIHREKTIGPAIHVEREHKTLPRFRVGRPIKLGPEIRQALNSAKLGNATWKLEQRYLVRGHWRKQPYGPAHSLRRPKFIQPHWKGPSNLTEAMERTFEVT